MSNSAEDTNLAKIEDASGGDASNLVEQVRVSIIVKMII